MTSASLLRPPRGSRRGRPRRAPGSGRRSAARPGGSRRRPPCAAGGRARPREPARCSRPAPRAAPRSPGSKALLRSRRSGDHWPRGRNGAKLLKARKGRQRRAPAPGSTARRRGARPADRTPAGRLDRGGQATQDATQGRRPTVATIDLGALAANYALAADRAGARDVIAVVKADAYGHGAVTVSRALIRAGCPRLAVLMTEEAAELRDAGIRAPLLLLGGVHDAAEAQAAAALSATPVLHHAEQAALVAREAGRRGGPLPVHVEVDTGMRRMGVAPDQAVALLEKVHGEAGLRLEGVMTQLARAEEPDLGPSLAQLQTLAGILRAARSRGIDPGLVHFANSAALLRLECLEGALPGARAVRPGLMLYGAAPAPDLGAALRPVMTLRTRVVQVRTAGPGDGVGYGSTWRARAPTRIATLALGYADGVPCSRASRGHVLVRGRRLPVVGRVSMDFVTVDAGQTPVAVGDEAIVFGAGPEGTLPVEEAAREADTIPYELLSRVGPRVPRVVVA